MIVISRPNMLRRILDEIEAKRRQNRIPECIVVDEEEFVELQYQSGHSFGAWFEFVEPGYSPSQSIVGRHTRGFCRPRRAANHMLSPAEMSNQPFYRADEKFRINGVAGYVVPREFHPQEKA